DFQHSIADQIRGILEHAVSLRVHVPRENICYDAAVRGYKDRRAGLNQAKELLARRAGQVLLVFTTNRLYRKMYKAMKFVEEEVVDRGLRCVFVKTGIDTAGSQTWRMPLQVNAMVDEMSAS